MKKIEIKETVLVVRKTVCAYIPLIVAGGRVREGVPEARLVRSPRTICVYVERMDIKRHTSILRDRRRGRIGARREREKRIKRTPKAVKTNKMTVAVIVVV